MSQPYHGPWAVLSVEEMEALLEATHHREPPTARALYTAREKLRVAVNANPKFREPHA